MVSAPRPLTAGGVEKAVFMTDRDTGPAADFRAGTLGGLVKGFVESGRYAVIPMEGEAHLEGAKALARSRGAGTLVYLSDARASIESNEHPGHSYIHRSP